MKKILIVFGTRPEAIKMSPLVFEFKKYVEEFDVKVCVTAQHRQMLDQVMKFFHIEPDYDLNLMKPNQNLHSLTADIIVGLKTVFEEFAPDYVFVHGDTTTSMAASLAAFYSQIKVCHVEAGLRTFNKHSPFPEEINRTITGRLADVHFAPTQQSKQNLLDERVCADSVVVTGNTVIDALYRSVKLVDELEGHVQISMLKDTIDFNRQIVLVTGHRRENFGDGFINICEALKKIAEQLPETEVVYPVHLNPNVQKPVFDLLKDVKNIRLIEPLSYEAFVWLMSRAKLIITDSGGVQEEAPSLGKPVLVMRDTTERPEAVAAGTVILVGTDKERIYSEAVSLLTDKQRYEKMSQLHNPYGDGKACERIVDFLRGKHVAEYN